MPSDVLQREKMYFVSSGFGFEPRVHAKAGGGKIFQGVPVFRSGSFADSMGRRNTWEDLHIKQMVDNLTYLTNKKIIDSVPVRDGHPEFLVHGMRGKGEVVGWHHGVTTEVRKNPVDGKEYTYLLVDYEITAQYALDKIDRGLWRNRSAEIVPYETNDEAEFWPVYLGFAFVDFGAVEGLNFSMSQGNRSFVVFGESSLKENIVSGTPQQTTPSTLIFGAPVVPQAEPVAPVAQPTPFVFSCNGQNVTDLNQVQTYIRQLETFTRETREAGRRAYVESLVSANKLAAPQLDGQVKFAMSLNDEQFAAWKAQWDVAMPSSTLSAHGSGSVGSAAPGSAQAAADQEIQDAKDIVAMHRTNGMSPENLKKTGSYQKLVAAGIEKA